MRYHYSKPKIYAPMYGEVYICNHPVYSRCTLYKQGNKGLAVIQQRYDILNKHTWWTEIDPWIANDIYLNENFRLYFEERSDEAVNGLFPTVTVRQIMWALKMKPIKRERWETVFDKRDI